jgi:hypothetical protein
MTDDVTLFTVQAMNEDCIQRRSDALMSLFIRRQRLYCNDPDPVYAALMVSLAKQITTDDIQMFLAQAYECDTRR